MPTDTQSQIAELEAKILALRSSQVTELRDQLRAASQTVAELETEIAKITGGKAPVALKPERRTRTSSEDVKGGILKVLAAAPTGLSQKEISDSTDLSYSTVALFLKKNLKDFKTTGKLKAKRYFLK
jgi:hypothetical protein